MLMTNTYANIGQQSSASQLGGVGVQDMHRKPELVSQIDRLDQAINYADEALLRLRDRLENGSLRPDAPQAIGSEPKVQAAPPSSGYANTVHQFADRVNLLAHRAQALLERLEV